MTRHQRNSTAGSVYTYHERKKDAKQSGYGAENTRFGKDSMKEFDCCSLTLQPCRNPVVTLDGVLFDKEAVLEYILQQKREIARKLKEYEKQKKKMVIEQKEKKAVEHDNKVQKFVEKESCIISKPYNPFKNTDAGEGTSKSICNMVNGKDKALPSFWCPSLTPQSKPTILEKPDEKVRCPMSGKILKLKDLIPVEFTLAKDGDKRSLITKDLRYVCPVTNDALGNSVPCAALRTSGKIVTMECIEKLIKKDMLDPFNGKKMTDKDIIPLQRGATGFAGSGLVLLGKKDRPSLQA